MSKKPTSPELAKLRAEVDEYISAREMAETRFGIWAVNDPNLVRDIKAGRELRWSTICTIREKMAEASQ